MLLKLIYHYNYFTNIEGISYMSQNYNYYPYNMYNELCPGHYKGQLCKGPYIMR